jgi:hypothetical protein
MGRSGTGRLVVADFDTPARVVAERIDSGGYRCARRRAPKAALNQPEEAPWRAGGVTAATGARSAGSPAVEAPGGLGQTAAAGLHRARGDRVGVVDPHICGHAGGVPARGGESIAATSLPRSRHM